MVNWYFILCIIIVDVQIIDKNTYINHLHSVIGGLVPLWKFGYILSELIPNGTRSSASGNYLAYMHVILYRSLTHCGLMMQYGDTDLGQHCLG